MTHIPGRSTNNSVAAMLDSNQPSSFGSAIFGYKLIDSCSSSDNGSYFHPSQQDLTQAFSQALSDSLPQILAALQSHSTFSGSTTRSLAENLVSSATSSTFIASSPPLPFPSGSSTVNVFMPSFVSTYCTLDNSALSTPATVGAPSLVDASCGAASGSLSSTHRRKGTFGLRMGGGGVGAVTFLSEKMSCLLNA